jgi:two-component system, NarL family, sensor histidine kinase NreB
MVMHTDFLAEIVDHLPEGMIQKKELHLLRIIQESVTNSVRRGKATYVSIHLKTCYQYIFFQLYDNGKGFISGGCKTKGLGLKHMYERCKMLEGDIKWISKEGGPTQVEGFVSLTKAEEERKDEPYDH